MYIHTNPNPKGSYVGDCVIRALSIAMNKPWREIYLDLAAEGLLMGDMPSSNKVWGEYLTRKGYKRHVIPSECPMCYTIRDFCGEYFRGTYIVGTGTHVVCIKDGNLYDSWDSSDETPIFYFKGEE